MAELAVIDEGVDREIAVALQAQLDATNASDEADHDVPWFLAVFRHSCPKARQSEQAGKGVSTAIALKERYVPDPTRAVALLYREGECKRCGQTARSTRGRAVLTSQRPPITGRVSRA